MPPIARGQTWLYQPSQVSTVPNTGRNLSNSNYGGHDEEEEGMGSVREDMLPWRKTSYCRCHELKCSAIFFPIQNGTHILSAPISLKNDIPCTMMPVSFAIISMRLYPCDTAFAACNITRVSNSSCLHGLSRYSDTSAPGTGLPNTFASRVDITSSFLHRIRSEQWLRPYSDLKLMMTPACPRLLDMIFTFLGPPDFGQSRHVCSWLTCCRWLFVAVV